MYPFQVSLSILEDLGRNLYTSVPAVLSELIANAYDADASRVDITFSDSTAEIIDNGIGMNEEDVTDRYLTVGYKRRREGAAFSPGGRAVMGRKGIGKLAVFAIADKVHVTTKHESGTIAFELDYDAIENAIMAKEEYFALPATPSAISSDSGTKLALTLNRRASSLTADQLKRRVARRFLNIGPGFQVFVNGEEVTPGDKDLLTKAQFIWLYGYSEEDEASLRAAYPKIKTSERRSGTISADKVVKGWIASATEPRALKESADEDSLNKIVVFTRDKVSHEDLLKHATDARVYTKYLFGELSAEFLDTDEQVDIATSSRQSFREDDPRFQDLAGFLQTELQHIREKWSEGRAMETVKLIEAVEPLKKWAAELSSDDRKRAGQLFQKIGNLGASKRKTVELVKFAVIAFETFRFRGNLDKLDTLDITDISSWGPLFASLESFEAACYFQVTLPRLKAIEKLKRMVDENVLEKFLQEYIAKELWLLDPTWDPITENPLVERDMKKVVTDLKETGDTDERAGRVDIKYAKTNFGKHVIIELKRHKVRVSQGVLLDQAKKYVRAAKNALKAAKREGEPVEVVILVGGLKDYDERLEVERTLQQAGARVVFYKELIDNAESTYRAFIDANAKAGGILEVLGSVEDFFATEDDE